MNEIRGIEGKKEREERRPPKPPVVPKVGVEDIDLEQLNIELEKIKEGIRLVQTQLAELKRRSRGGGK